MDFADILWSSIGTVRLGQKLVRPLLQKAAPFIKQTLPGLFFFLQLDLFPYPLRTLRLNRSDNFTKQIKVKHV